MATIRTIQAELSTPKYANSEFERRWLVDVDGRPPLDGVPFVSIVDRYIEGTRLRLRRMIAPDGLVALQLTKKYEADDASARLMVVSYLTEEEYEAFSDLPGAELTKRRYKMPHAGLIWDIDVFDGPLVGLELVEIEASDREELRAIEPPPWVVREVTHDLQFQCGSLAHATSIPKV